MADDISRLISDFISLNNPGIHSSTPQSALARLQSFLDQALNAAAADDPEYHPCLLWEKLASNNISVLSFTRPINSAMGSGSVSISLLAYKVYLSLILSPNSPAPFLFTSTSFLTLLYSLRRALKKNARASPPSDVRPARVLSTDCDDEQGESESEFDVRVLFDVLDKLGLVLRSVCLDGFPNLLESLVQTTAENPVLGLEFFGNCGNYTKLCDLCEQILLRVLKPEHGKVVANAVEVLLSSLTFLVNSPAKRFALGFVTNHMMDMANYSDDIRKRIVNLPRCLLHMAPEKTESRASTVESITKIVKAMRFEDQVEFINYVLNMCQGMDQVGLLVVDLIPMFLLSVKDPFVMRSNGDGFRNSWGLSCLLALVERCSDSVAQVRARAMSNLAHVWRSLSSNETSGSTNIGKRRRRSDGGDMLSAHLLHTRAHGDRMMALLEGEANSIAVAMADLPPSIERGLEVIKKMTKAGMLEENSVLWCLAVVLNKNDKHRRTFLALDSDENRLALLILEQGSRSRDN